MVNGKFAIIIAIAVISLAVITLYLVWQEPENSPSKHCYGDVCLPENDKLCSVTFRINQVSMEPNQIEEYVREEIGKLGTNYDFQERQVTVLQKDSNAITIRIGGSWSFSGSEDRPSLKKILSDLNLGEIEEKVMTICE